MEPALWAALGGVVMKVIDLVIKSWKDFKKDKFDQERQQRRDALDAMSEVLEQNRRDNQDLKERMERVEEKADKYQEQLGECKRDHIQEKTRRLYLEDLLRQKGFPIKPEEPSDGGRGT